MITGWILMEFQGFYGIYMHIPIYIYIYLHIHIHIYICDYIIYDYIIFDYVHIYIPHAYLFIYIYLIFSGKPISVF